MSRNFKINSNWLILDKVDNLAPILVRRKYIFCGKDTLYQNIFGRSRKLGKIMCFDERIDLCFEIMMDYITNGINQK